MSGREKWRVKMEEKKKKRKKKRRKKKAGEKGRKETVSFVGQSCLCTGKRGKKR